jgi:hypothetical protein
MHKRRNFLLGALVVSGVLAAAAPRAWAQAPLPDMSGGWNHSSLNGLELPLSGPGPVTNRSRLRGGPQAGVGNGGQLVGDYTNPILQPWAAEVVKKHGEMSLAGITYGNASNQCWPMPMLFVYKQFLVRLLQRPDDVVLVYNSSDIRRVRLNDRHPEPLTPSWYGDSVGHYEGDTLVIDTVGVKADRPYAMIDLFGTPYTKSLHVVERYRLREYDDVKDAIERNIKENWLFTGDVFSKHRGKFLQVHLTVEDAGAFTTPWTSTMTYVPGPDGPAEGICAENPHQYYYDRSDAKIPHADKPDF